MSLGSKAFRQKLLATFFITASISLSFLLIYGQKNHMLSWQLPRVEGEFVGPSLSSPTLSTSNPQQAEDIAKEIAQSIVAENPIGPTLEGGVPGISTIDPEQVASTILSQRIEDITRSILEPKINAGAIVVLPVSTPESNIEYLKNRGTLIYLAAGELNKHKIDFSNPSMSDLRNVIELQDALLEQLYALPVPKNLVTLHTEQLRLATIERIIFENMANYETDALTASVSVALLEQTNEQGIKFVETVKKFISDNNLKLN